MNPKSVWMTRSWCIASCALVLVVICGCVRHASAQGWRAVDAQNAWSGYQTAFVHLQSDGYSKIFVTKQGATTGIEGFWTYAEEIEVAEDAYYENPTTDNKNLVEALCDGFVNYEKYGGAYVHDDWTIDPYNDDLGVAMIAFTRAYSITGTTRWLNDAEYAYSNGNKTGVWDRAQAGDGGLCQNVKLGCYENSSANWTFVIAGNLLYNVTGDSLYQTSKNSVYTWAKANLYNSSTGEIYDAKGGVTGQYTYNYGFAMRAGAYQGSNVMVPNIAQYVFGLYGPPNELTNYDGTTAGYEIMPNYGQGDLNNSGFNGILMRGVGDANNYGYIPASVMDAAQANIDQAWANRNGTTTLVWNDWGTGSGDKTPGTGTYGWDDSAAMAGLLDLPPTAN